MYKDDTTNFINTHHVEGEMIDTNELRRKVNSTDIVDHIDLHANIKPFLSEMIDRLEAAEKERDNYKFVFNEFSEKTEWVQQGINDGTISTKYLGWHRADVMYDLLSAAEKERDVLRDRLALESQENGALHDAVDRACEERDALRAALRHEADCVEAAKAKIEALRSKIEAIEKQEPFDADSDVFRSAFEAALKAGNWPATRQGDGYRSPSTQIAWRIAFSTINRLKLYLAPGAQGE